MGRGGALEEDDDGPGPLLKAPGVAPPPPKARASSFIYQPTVVEAQVVVEQVDAPLSKLECAHAKAVVRKMVDKLQLLNALPVDIVKRGADMSRSVGDEVTRMVDRQAALEERFDALFTIRSTLKAMPNKTKYNENQDEARRIAVELRTTTEQLSRTLRDNPNVSDNIVKAAADRTALLNVLQSLLMELEDKGTYKCLTQFVHDADERERTMQETIERERAETARVRALKQQLKQEREEHEEMVAEKKKVLNTLKQELRDVKQTTYIEGHYSEKEMGAERMRSDRLLSEEIAKLEAERDLLNKKIPLEAKAHATSADFLSRHVAQKQQEILDWSLRHESDTQAKDKELERLRNSHQRDSAKLKEAEAALVKEKEMKEANELAMRERAKMELMERCAIKIQRAYRKYAEAKKAAKEAAKAKKKADAKNKGKKK